MNLYSLFIIILAITFVTQPTHAQVHTGGGIVKPFAEDKPYGGAAIYLDELLNAFVLQLNTQQEICLNHKIEVAHYKPDFINEYMSLVLKKSFDQQNKKCRESKIYFQCLNSPALKEKLKPILQYSPDIIVFLKFKYQLDQKQATEALDFFRNLEVTCPVEKVRCEM